MVLTSRCNFRTTYHSFLKVSCFSRRKLQLIWIQQVKIYELKKTTFLLDHVKVKGEIAINI